MEGECSCYGGGQFHGGRIVMLQRWSLEWREKGHVTELFSVGKENGYVTELASLMEGEWSCYSLMEGEWSFYRGGQFNGGSVVMLQRRPV